MTTFDVHTDKALKELRARLDQAERERDEANERHAALAEHVVACLPYEAETDGEALDAWECVDAASREIASAGGPSAPPGPCPTCEAVWAATGVASVVRGLAALDDVVQTTREHLIEARRERDSYARRIAALRTTLGALLAADEQVARAARGEP